MSRRPRPLAVLLLSGCLLLAGCTASSVISPQTPRPAMRLVAFDSCAQLGSELRAAARQSIGPDGLPGAESPALAGGIRTMMDPPVPAAAGRAAVTSEAGTGFSGTNTHEAGVDEPDLVKTDGRRIVTVSSAGILTVVDPATATTTGRLDLRSGPYGVAGTFGQARLLLAGDHALVLVDGGGYQVLGRRIRPADSGSDLLLVDLGGPPRLISRYRSAAAVIDARQNGDVAHIVLSTRPNLIFPLRADSTDGLLRENRKVIDAAGVDAWLPSWEITTGATTTPGRLGCGSVSRPATFSGTAVLTVLTFDLNAAALTDGAPVGIVADGDTVYGTANSLYVANDQGWRDQMNRVPIPVPGPTQPPSVRSASLPSTEIYRFALAGMDKPVVTASGVVPGRLLNQYSLSEWDGYLRVATTEESQDASAVRVLQERNGKLVEVGAVTGLGHGEQIYAVRFLGPRGYVVTFRQTDPLYSLDLSVPADPRVTGALKMNGFSAHLQPIDDDRLIGIGEDAATDGSVRGAQISLFDVADPAAPRRLAQVSVPQGRSEAGYDPHALLWWPATRLLVLPITDPTASGVLAVRVTADGLQTVGRIAAPDVNAPIRRELVIGSTLWTVSDAGLLASNLSTLDKIAWLPVS